MKLIAIFWNTRFTQATQSDLLPEEPKSAKTKTGKPAPEKPAAKAKQDKQRWPKTLPEQANAVQVVLAEMENATPEQVAERLKEQSCRRWKKLFG